MRTRPRHLAILLVTALAIGSTLSVSGLAAPVARATTTLEVCGKVSVYVKPTTLLAGAITIGGTPWIIAAGTAVSSDVKVGASLCVRLTLNLTGAITQLVVVRADASSYLKVCGVVSAYVSATGTKTGSLKIGHTTLTIALNTTLPAAVKVGADLCATLELNAFGQVRDGEVVANATTTLRICGVVSAYVAATATKTGSLTIAGHSLVVAMGASLPASVKVGADLCLALELNAFGQVQDCQALANVTTTLTVCGQVTAFVAASAAQNGSLSIGGTTKSIAAGTNIDGRVSVGAYLRLRLVLDAFGRISDVVVLRVGVSVSDACDGPTPSPKPSPSATPTQSPTPSAKPTPSANPTATATASPSAAPSATPSAAPTSSAGPNPTPGPSATPAPTGPPGPTTSPEPGPTLTPDPHATTVPTSTPDPYATLEPSATPVPTSTPDPRATPSPAPDLICPAPGDHGDQAGGTGSGNGPAPVLPDTASAVERAGQVIASAAIPFVLFAMGMLMTAVLGSLRRRTAPASAAWEVTE